jgi:hypothetical protein
MQRLMAAEAKDISCLCLVSPNVVSLLECPALQAGGCYG